MCVLAIYIYSISFVFLLIMKGYGLLSLKSAELIIQCNCERVCVDLQETQDLSQSPCSNRARVDIKCFLSPGIIHQPHCPRKSLSGTVTERHVKAETHKPKPKVRGAQVQSMSGFFWGSFKSKAHGQTFRGKPCPRHLLLLSSPHM